MISISYESSTFEVFVWMSSIAERIPLWYEWIVWYWVSSLLFSVIFAFALLELIRLFWRIENTLFHFVRCRCLFGTVVLWRLISSARSLFLPRFCCIGLVRGRASFILLLSFSTNLPLSTHPYRFTADPLLVLVNISCWAQDPVDTFRLRSHLLVVALLAWME